MASSLIEPTARVWFVTGASSGLGRHVTERALENGDNVIATLRSPFMLADLVVKYRDTSQLLVLALDVTDTADVTRTFRHGYSTFGRIDVVFNNAGFFVIEEVEATSDSNARDMFDTMFWGAGNVMREAVRCFREVNKPRGGYLLNVSSRTAFIPQTGAVMYAAVKRGKYLALETLTEGYAAELDPEWNIKLVLLEPALFLTSAIIRCRTGSPPPAYESNRALPSMEYRARYPTLKQCYTGDPGKLADLVYRLVQIKDLPSLVRLPVHQVALDAAKQKGAILVEAAEKAANWPENAEFDQAA